MLTTGALSAAPRSALRRGPHVVLVAAGLSLAAAWLVAQSAVSAALIVPIVAILAFALACAVALVALSSQPEGRGLSYWDVAGLLTFAGICVTQAIEPDALVQVVRDLNSPHPTVAER